jgi:NAD(P)-dependent dehydrogenase (short-subunit alcohol dehydrogenase family)
LTIKVYTILVYRMVHNARSPKSFLTDPPELQGQRALVTGGSPGIGAAIVQRLLDAGAKVVASARNPVADFPSDAAFIQADVSTLAGARSLAAQTVETLSGVDILINNAGAARAPSSRPVKERNEL